MVRLFADDVPDILTSKAEKILADARKNWCEAVHSASSDERLAAGVRQFRNRCHFAIALAPNSPTMKAATINIPVSEATIQAFGPPTFSMVFISAKSGRHQF